MPQVWFSCSSLVLSEYGVKMTATLEGCTKGKQYAVVCSVAEGMKEAEIHEQLTAMYGQNCLLHLSMYEWIRIFKSS
jgi:hypothetical protein